MFSWSASLVLCAAFCAQADDAAPRLELLRDYYGKIATRYEFDSQGTTPKRLELVKKPVMRWFNDGDWSGDVFVWTRSGRPEVLGCVLSGPQDSDKRIVFREFHLLGEDPIAQAQMPDGSLWAPAAGLTRRPLEGAPKPAGSAALRLTQMRTLLRDFSAHMRADEDWELRLLPQPLMRYQPEEGPVVDGALFTFVWTKGTDPELVLLLECRKTPEGGQAWSYAPVQFSNRPLWLKHGDTEVWRVDSHSEPAGTNDTLYTTRYHETISTPAP